MPDTTANHHTYRHRSSVCASSITVRAVNNSYVTVNHNSYDVRLGSTNFTRYRYIEHLESNQGKNIANLLHVLVTLKSPFRDQFIAIIKKLKI